MGSAVLVSVERLYGSDVAVHGDVRLARMLLTRARTHSEAYMKRRSLVAVLFAVFAPAVALAAVASDSKTYKNIETDKVFEAAREAITSNGWRLKDESKEDGLLVARTKISAMSWGAVVSVSITDTKNGVKVVASAGTEMSSSGKVDKDIERFFDKLERKLEKYEDD